MFSACLLISTRLEEPVVHSAGGMFALCFIYLLFLPTKRLHEAGTVKDQKFATISFITVSTSGYNTDNVK